jgi:hypothetical protein
MGYIERLCLKKEKKNWTPYTLFKDKSGHMCTQTLEKAVVGKRGDNCFIF